MVGGTVSLQRGAAFDRGVGGLDVDYGSLDLGPMTKRDNRRLQILLLAGIVVVILGGLGLVGLAMLVVTDVEVVVEELETLVDVEVEVVESGERHIGHHEGDDGGEHHRPRNPDGFATTHHRLDLPGILPDRTGMGESARRYGPEVLR